MDLLSKTVGRVVQRAVDRFMGAGLMQEENAAAGERWHAEGFPELIRQAGAEACVLLKNDGTLPLKKDEELAVFGRCQLDWFYVGYGSGGDVHPAWRVNLMQGLRNAGQKLNEPLADRYASWCADNPPDPGWWGHWPFYYPEMELPEHEVREASKTARTALVVIGRAAGEDRENRLEQGSYYLTEEERDILDMVTGAFSRVVVLMNIGSIMDMAWTEDYGDRLSAVLIAWQGGMESGNAAADILCGMRSPSGRLSDTIARYHVDYPSSKNFGGKDYNNYAEGIFVGYRHFERYGQKCVLFPFGFGLSYTEFAYSDVALDRETYGPGDVLKVSFTLSNTGHRDATEVAQVYVRDLVGSVTRPVKERKHFERVALKAGESRRIEVEIPVSDLAFWGLDGRKMVEPGDFQLWVAGDSASGEPVPFKVL